MWNAKQTLYNRRNADIKEALHVFCQKNMISEASKVSLELFESRSGKAVMEKLRNIAVEDKFPKGAQYMEYMNKHIKSWRNYTYETQKNIILSTTQCIAEIPTNRHTVYLARMSREKGNSLELTLANKAEYYLLRHQMKNDFSTLSDLRKKTITKNLKSICFNNKSPTPVQQAVWDHFEQIMDTKEEARYFLYTLIALNFHAPEYIPSLDPPKPKMIIMDKVILPDYVYNRNTRLGRERKRGYSHFFDTISSASSKLKKRARELMLEDEKTKYSRKKLRIDFLELTTFKGIKISKWEMIKVPSASHGGTWIMEAKDKYLIHGPYEDRSKLDYQMEMDKKKPSFGLKKVGYEIFKYLKFYYIVCPLYEGEPLSATKQYDDLDMHSILQILIFRGVHLCSKSELRNIIQLDTGEFLSVNEFDTQSRSGNILDFLLTKKPNKSFLKPLLIYIDKNKETVNQIFRKHNQSLNNFNLNIKI